MTGSDETSSTSGLTWRNMSTRKAGVSNHSCIPTFGRPGAELPDGTPDRATISRSRPTTSWIWPPTEPKTSTPPSGEARPELGLLGGERDELRRAGGGDDRPRLRPIRPEQVAVVVVVHHHDRRQALLAHPGLDPGDPIVSNVHAGLRLTARAVPRRRHQGTLTPLSPARHQPSHADAAKGRSRRPLAHGTRRPTPTPREEPAADPLAPGRGQCPSGSRHLDGAERPPRSYAGFFGFFGLGGRFGVLSPMENLPASRGAPPAPARRSARRPGSAAPVADTIADLTRPVLRGRDGRSGGAVSTTGGRCRRWRAPVRRQPAPRSASLSAEPRRQHGATPRDTRHRRRACAEAGIHRKWPGAGAR